MDIGKPKLGDVSAVPSTIKNMEKTDINRNKITDNNDIIRSMIPLIL
jgi:hypothetical protein